jgi:hypothetical protein
MSGRAPLDVTISGAGERLLLVHGVNREQTWGAQEPLGERWRLVMPARRGYPPSPPAERQASGEPAVQEFMALAAAYTGDDPVARERAREEFEAVARIRFPEHPEQERAFTEARRLAPGLRPPGEARWPGTCGAACPRLQRSARAVPQRRPLDRIRDRNAGLGLGSIGR